MQRADILDAAKAAICDRPGQYGKPEDNFARIAARWNVHLRNIGYGGERALEPHDIAAMMVDLKLARIENDPAHCDSWVDVAGYAACGAQCVSVAAGPVLLEDARQTYADELRQAGNASPPEAEPLYFYGHPYEFVPVKPGGATRWGFHFGQRVVVSSKNVGGFAGRKGTVVGFADHAVIVEHDNEVGLRYWQPHFLSAA